MRLAVFIFSFYLVFGQIYYAHSALPVLGGAVAVARGVGTLIKGGKVLKGSMWGAGAVYAYCTATPANKKRCKELGGEVVELILGDDDDDNRVYCTYRVAPYFNDLHKNNNHFDKKSAYDVLINELNSFYAYNEYKHHNDKYDEALDNAIKVHNKKISDGNQKDTNNKFLSVGTFVAPVFYRQKTNVNAVYQEQRYTFYLYANCSDDINALGDDLKKEIDEQQKRREKELWDKLKDKLSDDDITNIVNNYGDDIDIDKYCATGATCYFIEPEFEKEINNNDYDIDKVTNDNCNTRNGKIYSCPKAKKKKDRDDDDDRQTDDDKKDDDGQTNNDDKDKDGIKIPNIPNFALPKFCTWAKHVCDFTEWVKEPPKIDNNDDYKPEIKELSDLGNQDINKSYYNASGACPAPVAVNLTYGTVYMSYQNYCDFAIRISPLVIALAYILGAYIVARGR